MEKWLEMWTEARLIDISNNLEDYIIYQDVWFIFCLPTSNEEREESVQKALLTMVWMTGEQIAWYLKLSNSEIEEMKTLIQIKRLKEELEELESKILN